jgi:hypothetical protein
MYLLTYDYSMSVIALLEKLFEKVRTLLTIRGGKGILEGRPPQTPLVQVRLTHPASDGTLNAAQIIDY